MTGASAEHIRVLVVDDHDLVAESLARALGAEPDLLVVGSAGSSAGALDAARALRPDVVVMDYRLPDGTGAQATTLMKAELPKTEVVMLTAEASGASLADALEAGCSGFVAKEGRFEELVQTIRAVAAGEVRVPQRLVEELATHLRPRSAGLGADLTPREREVLELLAAGRSTSDIVDALTLSIHTVRNHIRNILSKLDARSRSKRSRLPLGSGSSARGPVPRVRVPELSDAVLRRLLLTAPDAIVVVSSSGRIVFVNAHTESLFGYTGDELVGRSIEILVPEGARAIHPSRRASYVSEPVPRRMGAAIEVAARRRDGSEFAAEISLSFLETDEGLLVSAAIRDVSERIEAPGERVLLQSQLQQSQRLESLGQLAGGVAHDFNNLMSVIVNYAAFVREEATANIERGADAERWEGVRRDVEQIERAGERATHLTHQLLAFARREVVRPEVLDLNRVVADVEQLLQRTIGEHVELSASLGEQLHPVLADPGQIEQVLVDLALNARDAMPTGGILIIDTQNVIVDALYAERCPGLAPGACVRLRVSDTGVGMTKDVAERAFEPFFTTKPRTEGSGLGLATVYGIINQAGGSVHISSEPGIGTTIRALLPAVDGTVAAPDAAAPARRFSGEETILVVEDEAAMREVTRRMLTRNGYSVLTAANGPEALSIASERGEEIQLLLTDVIMPRMLGKEVAERMRAMRPNLPVLFMSGYAQPILAAQGTPDTGVTLLEKPFSEADLLDKVREVLDSD